MLTITETQAVFEAALRQHPIEIMTSNPLTTSDRVKWFNYILSRLTTFKENHVIVAYGSDQLRARIDSKVKQYFFDNPVMVQFDSMYVNIMKTLIPEDTWNVNDMRELLGSLMELRKTTSDNQLRLHIKVWLNMLYGMTNSPYSQLRAADLRNQVSTIGSTIVSSIYYAHDVALYVDTDTILFDCDVSKVNDIMTKFSLTNSLPFTIGELRRAAVFRPKMVMYE